MTGKAVGWAFEQPIENPNHKFVLVCLADVADDYGICFPGFGKISKKTSLSRSTIVRAIKALEDDGFLEKVNRPKGDGYWTTNAYKLPVYNDRIDDHPLSSLFKTPSVTETPPSVTETPPSVTETPPSVTVTPPDTPLNPINKKERENALTREEFLRGIDAGWKNESFKLEGFDHLTESEIKIQADECWDRWGGNLKRRDPVLILRSWLRKGMELKTVRKPPKPEKCIQGGSKPEPDTPEQAWQSKLKPCLSSGAFNSWIRPLYWDGNGAVYAPSSFHADYVGNHFRDDIARALHDNIEFKHPYPTDMKGEQAHA